MFVLTPFPQLIQYYSVFLVFNLILMNILIYLPYKLRSKPFIKNIAYFVSRYFFLNTANKFLLQQNLCKQKFAHHIYLIINYSPRYFIKMLSWWPSQSQRLPNSKVAYFYYFFHFYIHFSALQKSVGDTILSTSNSSDMFPKMPKYCCPIKIFLF